MWPGYPYVEYRIFSEKFIQLVRKEEKEFEKTHPNNGEDGIYYVLYQTGYPDSLRCDNCGHRVHQYEDHDCTGWQSIQIAMINIFQGED